MVAFVRPAAAKKKRCCSYRRYGFWGLVWGGSSVQCVKSGRLEKCELYTLPKTKRYVLNIDGWVWWRFPLKHGTFSWAKLRPFSGGGVRLFWTVAFWKNLVPSECIPIFLGAGIWKDLGHGYLLLNSFIKGWILNFDSANASDLWISKNAKCKHISRYHLGCRLSPFPVIVANEGL